MNTLFIEAKAIIPGPSDIYVKQGSEVVLTCIVSQGPHELGQIIWLRGKSSLQFIVYIAVSHIPQKTQDLYFCCKNANGNDLDYYNCNYNNGSSK